MWYDASIEGGGVPHRDQHTDTTSRSLILASIEGGGVPHRDTQLLELAEDMEAASIEGGGVPHRDGKHPKRRRHERRCFNRGWGGSPP